MRAKFSIIGQYLEFIRVTIQRVARVAKTLARLHKLQNIVTVIERPSFGQDLPFPEQSFVLRAGPWSSVTFSFIFRLRRVRRVPGHER
jgi:hypothetical protein